MQRLRRPLLAYCMLHLASSSAFLSGPRPIWRDTFFGRGSALVYVSRGINRFGRFSSTTTRTPPGLAPSVSGTSGRSGSSGNRGHRVSFGDGESVGDDGERSSWEDWGTRSSGGEGENLSSSWEDPAQSKWEALYAEGEKEKRSSTFLSAMADWGKGGVHGAVEVDYAMPVRVVSFDLDDTLWSTTAVINQANAALQEHLSREHPALAEKCVIADHMKEVWKEKLVKDPTLDPAPVNLTELRKAGLARACDLVGADPSAVVESSFEVWRRARHDVEPHLFPGVLETLAALRERGIRLVAITNGNAQTDDIPCLKDFFDFCVMAEQVGERKPQPGPFQAAVMRAGYPSDDSVGGEWVHVGDDWASDCVGAKKMRMRTVLVRVPGKPAVGSAPEVYKEKTDEQPQEQVDTLDGVDLDDDDDDDEFPTLEDETSPSDESPEGRAQRLREEQEKARRRAEKLEILIDSDFEVAAGTSGANMGQRRGPARESDGGGSDGGQKVDKGADEARWREDLMEQERKARAELKGKTLYGQEMTAIAMGHPEAALGPGKMMSMGGSSYVMDMLMKDFMDASLDNITEVVGLVDGWNKETSATSGYEEGEEADAVAAAVAAIEAGRSADGGGGGGGGLARRRNGEKFCTDCGVKIPLAAKFCPECGAKQETLAAR